MDFPEKLDKALEGVMCEKVTITAPDPSENNEYLVQYENNQTDLSARNSCLAYLRDCGFNVTCEPHPVVGMGDEPAISWGDLSDIVAPRDE